MFIIWLALRAGKMKQILRRDWLPERARWSYLAHSGLLAVSRKKNFPEIHIINPLLTKLVRSRSLDIGLILFCEFMDQDGVSVHKKELGQYPAILTSHLVNNPYLSFCKFSDPLGKTWKRIIHQQMVDSKKTEVHECCNKEQKSHPRLLY